MEILESQHPGALQRLQLPVKPATSLPCSFCCPSCQLHVGGSDALRVLGSLLGQALPYTFSRESQGQHPKETFGGGQAAAPFPVKESIDFLPVTQPITPSGNPGIAGEDPAPASYDRLPLMYGPSHLAEHSRGECCWRPGAKEEAGPISANNSTKALPLVKYETLVGAVPSFGSHHHPVCGKARCFMVTYLQRN